MDALPKSKLSTSIFDLSPSNLEQPTVDQIVDYQIEVETHAQEKAVIAECEEKAAPLLQALWEKTQECHRLQQSADVEQKRVAYLNDDLHLLRERERQIRAQLQQLQQLQQCQTSSTSSTSNNAEQRNQS